MCKCHQTSTELSARDTPIFPFPDNNMSMSGDLTNLVHVLILRSPGLGLLMGKFCQCLTVICPQHDYGGVL